MFKRVIINGDDNMIEAVYYQNIRCENPSVLINSPNPLYGGSMSNYIIYRIFHLMVKNHFSVLRFNYRGVGKSLGCFTHGKGELTDSSLCMNWLQNENPESKQYWVIGFSFGSLISMQLLMRRPEIKYFIVIFSNYLSYDFNFVSSCKISGIVLQNSSDFIQNYDNYLQRKFIIKKEFCSAFINIKNLNHFFRRGVYKIDNIIKNFISNFG